MLPPLGMDGDGKTYRVNSDAVALEVAKALGAVKLVYITTSDGLEVSGAVVRQVSVDELSSALDKGLVAPAQASKARHAVAACRFGVPRVHVIDGRVDEGLLAEVFSNEGIGTLVYANEYRQIRRARRRDIRSIQQLIQASVESEELLPRSQAAIERQLEDYYIYEVDRNPIACVALHVYPEEKTGEVACLRVRPSHENQGIGRRMTHYVEERAREMGLEKLLALSTQAYNFFGSKGGFAEGTPDDLPAGAPREVRAERPAIARPRQASLAPPQSQARAAHILRYQGASAGGAASVTFTPCALRRMSSIFQPVSWARFWASRSRRVLRSPS